VWVLHLGGVGRERTRREGERRRQRKIARAPSGRPPTEGNELGLVPGPATYIPVCWKVKTPLSLFLPIRINDSRYVRRVSAVAVGLHTTCGCRTVRYRTHNVCVCVCVRRTHGASPEGELSLSLDLSLTGQDASQEILAVLETGTAATGPRRLFFVILLGLA